MMLLLLKEIMNILDRSFYQRPTVEVARALLGAHLVREWQSHILSGIIVETEAYCGELDPASHAYRRQTKRNEAMFGPVGHTYVYFTYGNHFCLNIVAREKERLAGGVLLRGIIPIDGIEYMKELRKTSKFSRLTHGPGNIGQALHLRLSDNHIDVTVQGPLYIMGGLHVPNEEIKITPRIGISKAQDYLWRFVVSKQMQHDILENRSHYSLIP